MKIRRWLGSTALAVMALAMVVFPSMSQDAAAQAANLIRSADPVPGLYVVVLADQPSADAVDSIATNLTSTYGGTITHVYKYALQGFAVETSEASATDMSNDPAVEFVEEAGRFTTSDTQPNPPWGLDRIDQRDLPLNATYRYGRTGQGVNLFVIDTGIYYGHNDFGGRAFYGYDVFGGSGGDCHGHGTHVAGTAGGNTYGVAKAVRLYSVRVFNCFGQGNSATVLAGVNYVTWAAMQGALPAVANMSLAGAGNTAVDSAVVNSISAGVTYVVAAGNDSQPASNFSPARVPQAITVAASASNDVFAWWFSNYGPLVDIIAPGVTIRSAGLASPTAEVTLDGTSMASPHVAGAAARCLQANPSATPAQVTACVLSVATLNRINLVPGGTANRLLYTPTAPTAPANLQAATFSSTEIQLNWTDSQDETGYQIQRRELPNGGWGGLPLRPPDIPNFLDYALTPGTAYAYRIRAFNGEGYSEFSNEASANTSLPPPSNLAATVVLLSTRIRLTWTDNSPNEDGFRVERRTNATPFAQIVQVGAGQTTHDDTAVQPGVTYTYRVRAYRGPVNSPYSNEASATPIQPAPSNLGAVALSSTRIRLTWIDNSTDEGGFDVERRTGGGPFAHIIDVPAGQTAYEDTGLQPNVAYTYRVRAFVGTVQSAYSNEASATTMGIPPAPTALDPFGCGASLTPTLRWQVVPFAASYRVTVVDVASPTIPVFETVVSALSVTVPAGLLQPGHRYQWRVRGRNAALEEGPYSPPLVFATEACRLSIGDAQGPEGTGSNGTLVFTVSLSEVTSIPVSVQYATLDGSARAVADYAPVPPTPLAIPPGTPQGLVTITVVGDPMDEYDEDLFVQLSSPVGAVLQRDRGRGVILDDDLPPSLSIIDAAMIERTGTNGFMMFSVILSAVSGKRIEVQYLSADGTGPTAARSGTDYTAAQGTLVFAPESGTNQFLLVPIIADGIDEYDEHFFINIAPVDATTVSGGDWQGRGTILDDDPPPSLSVPSLSRREGNSGTQTLSFPFELFAVSGKTVDVQYVTRDDSATSPADYLPASGLVRLMPGERQGSADVEIVGDTDYEPAERFFLDLSGNPEDVTLPSPPSVEGTILNDDRACVKITHVPYTIVASGVYCLDRDLAKVFRDEVEAAITVDADNVVVDLNGFTLQALLDRPVPGPAPGPGPTLAAGIHALGRSHVTVKNGTIRGFHRGVFLEGMGDGTEGDQGHVVEGVNADGNTHEGIVVEGAGSIVRRNRVLGTGGGEGTAENRGIRVNGLRPQVVDNEVTETYGSGDGHGHGIHVDATGAVVERNRLGNAALVDNPVFGIVLLGADAVVVGNRLSTLDHGIVFTPQASGKYRDNMASGVTVPYQGGVSAGNNQ